MQNSLVTDMDAAANQEEIEIAEQIRFYESPENFLLNDIAKEETFKRNYPLNTPIPELRTSFQDQHCQPNEHNGNGYRLEATFLEKIIRGTGTSG